MDSQPKVFVVDDEVIARNTIEALLPSENYELYFAENGMQALSMAAEIKPDIILLDVMMPGLDGFETCKKIRLMANLAEIPIILITALDDQESRLAGLKAGADDFITKPFDIHELLVRIRNMTHRNRYRHMHPLTGLPSGILIEKQLQHLVDEMADWAMIDINIQFYKVFKEIYGVAAADDLLQTTALLIREEVFGQSSFSDNFIGHVREDHFVVCTREKQALLIRGNLKARFAQDVLNHYSLTDRQRGFLQRASQDGHDDIPLIKLAVGVVFSSEQSFTNLHEIVRLAANARSRDAS